MRGKDGNASRSRGCGRITPAYAGKSPTAKQRGILRRDHPRVCGEKPLPDPERIFQLGSPPRMRGKAMNEGDLVPIYGITPAYAGKSAVLVRHAPPVQDHPRVCGEKCSSKLFVKELSGSPPRMRGKAGYRRIPSSTLRITPAYAGKRSVYAFAACATWDHPRVCGEKTKKIP